MSSGWISRASLSRGKSRTKPRSKIRSQPAATARFTALVTMGEGTEMRTGSLKSVISVCAAAAIGVVAIWSVPGTTQTAQERSISLRDTFPPSPESVPGARVIKVQEPSGACGGQPAHGPGFDGLIRVEHVPPRE